MESDETSTGDFWLLSKDLRSLLFFWLSWYADKNTAVTSNTLYLRMPSYCGLHVLYSISVEYLHWSNSLCRTPLSSVIWATLILLFFLCTASKLKALSLSLCSLMQLCRPEVFEEPEVYVFFFFLAGTNFSTSYCLVRKKYVQIEIVLMRLLVSGGDGKRASIHIAF